MLAARSSSTSVYTRSRCLRLLVRQLTRPHCRPSRERAPRSQALETPRHCAFAVFCVPGARALLTESLPPSPWRCRKNNLAVHERCGVRCAGLPCRAHEEPREASAHHVAQDDTSASARLPQLDVARRRRSQDHHVSEPLPPVACERELSARAQHQQVQRHDLARLVHVASGDHCRRQHRHAQARPRNRLGASCGRDAGADRSYVFVSCPLLDRRLTSALRQLMAGPGGYGAARGATSTSRQRAGARTSARLAAVSAASNATQTVALASRTLSLLLTARRRSSRPFPQTSHCRGMDDGHRWRGRLVRRLERRRLQLAHDDQADDGRRLVQGLLVRAFRAAAPGPKAHTRIRSGA